MNGSQTLSSRPHPPAWCDKRLRLTLENGRSSPHLKYYPAIIAFLGYYPFDHEIETFDGKIKRYKYEHGYSNERLAEVLGVDETTVAQWERNERVPLKRSMDKVLSGINKKAAH